MGAFLARYRKGIAAALGAAAEVIVAVVVPDPYRPLAAAVLGALATAGVVQLPNAPAPPP